MPPPFVTKPSTERRGHVKDPTRPPSPEYTEGPASRRRRGPTRSTGSTPGSARPTGSAPDSVREVARTGEVHRDARGLRRFDGLGVADGSAGLDDGLDAGVDEDLKAVGEGEERVGRGD